MSQSATLPSRAVVPRSKQFDPAGFVEFVTKKNENLGTLLYQAVLELERDGYMAVLVDPEHALFVSLHRRLIEDLYLKFAGVKVRAIVVKLEP